MDTHQANRLNKKIDKLRREIDCVGDTKLRQALDDKATSMFIMLRDFLNEFNSTDNNNNN